MNAASALARKLTVPTRSSGVSSRWIARVAFARFACPAVRFVAGDVLRQRESRRERVHRDAVLADFACEAARHRDHRALARDVVEEKRYPFQRRAGGEVDDAAVPALAHVGNAGAAAEPHAHDVHFHDAAELAGGNLFEGPQLDRAEHRGVVHQDVDAAERLDGFLGHARDFGFRRNVDLEAEGLRSARARDLGRRLVELAQIGDDHRCALLRETRRDGPADAHRTAGDDRDLAFQPVHTTSS